MALRFLLALGSLQRIISQKTEAETYGFNVTGLPLMSNREAKHAASVLGGPSFHFLGPWRSSPSFLRGLNRKLVSGGYHKIHDFFHAEAAEGLYQEMLKLHRNGELVVDPRGAAGAGRQLEASSVAEEMANESCGRWERAVEVGGFRYHRHDWSRMGKPHPDSEHYPLLTSVIKGLGEKWAQVVNLLLTGSGMRIRGSPAKRMVRTGPLFNEYMAGDYISTHSDALDSRAFTLNVWLTSPGWRPEWGGSFLWCGAPSGNGFASAERLQAQFNSAVVFLPVPDSMHAVEPVLAPTSEHHRFGMQLWTGVRRMEAELHWDALTRRQAATGAAHLSAAPRAEL